MRGGAAVQALEAAHGERAAHQPSLGVSSAGIGPLGTSHPTRETRRAPSDRSRGPRPSPVGQDRNRSTIAAERLARLVGGEPGVRLVHRGGVAPLGGLAGRGGPGRQARWARARGACRSAPHPPRSSPGPPPRPPRSGPRSPPATAGCGGHPGHLTHEPVLRELRRCHEQLAGVSPSVAAAWLAVRAPSVTRLQQGQAHRVRERLERGGAGDPASTERHALVVFRRVLAML